ncbi:MAG TPA: acyl-CoA dehydrogenase [Jatrophihabitantaceae bacterium]|jgi:alkylation response protein AidB-like acyl-CoA dehydrogenase|nr:acyl-CoA dehydrogenase [Jatrophihabitantaceae bacterium]
MRFESSDSAVALRDATRALLTAEVTPAVVRAGWPDGDLGTVRTVWRKLADSGVIGALVPEQSDGLGLDEEALVPTLERIGHSGLPLPVVETIAVAAPAMLWHARLGDVVSGDAVVAIAQPSLREESPLLAFGQDCDLALVLGEDDLRLYERSELTLEPAASIDGARRMARIVAMDGGVVLADDPAAVASAWLRGVLGTAAVLVGLSERMLDMTVEYVKQREQFGVPVGSFQAIKHALAAALLSLRFAHPPVLAAGWALATQAPDAAVQVSAAKALASEAALRIARTAIQCHGAIAYTTEYDLHLFAKRAWAMAPSWGDAAWHRRSIAAHLGL